jgi:RNA polymerase sigma-70 factor (ECF subfamily)
VAVTRLGGRGLATGMGSETALTASATHNASPKPELASQRESQSEAEPELNPDDAVGERWLAGARAGQQTAFAELYLAVQPKLLRYAAGLVGQDAEDVTGEAWLQISRDLRGFSGDFDAFRGWAARIVRNRAIDHLRRRARRPVLLTDLEFLLDQPTADDAAGIAAEHISTGEAIALIASLPPDQAEAVLLRTVMGLDAASTGEILGKRPGAVRVASHRGLRTLARRLEQQPVAADA